MPRKPSMDRREAIELRRNREAGLTLKEAAAVAGVSVATACRALADLRSRMGPEKFCDEKYGERARHRARAHLYANPATSHNTTSNTSK